MLETERLVIREFSLQDAQFILKLLNTEGWLKFIGDRNVHSNSDALKYISKLNEYIKINSFGFWAVELKGDKKLVGLCGLIKRNELKFMDIGFAFLPNYQNRGYAFEAANAILNFTKEKLKANSISAITIDSNFSSIKLIERLGLTYRNEIEIDGEMLKYYELNFINNE